MTVRHDRWEDKLLHRSNALVRDLLALVLAPKMVIPEEETITRMRLIVGHAMRDAHAIGMQRASGWHPDAADRLLSAPALELAWATRLAGIAQEQDPRFEDEITTAPARPPGSPKSR